MILGCSIGRLLIRPLIVIASFLAARSKSFWLPCSLFQSSQDSWTSPLKRFSNSLHESFLNLLWHSLDGCDTPPMIIWIVNLRYSIVRLIFSHCARARSIFSMIGAHNVRSSVLPEHNLFSAQTRPEPEPCASSVPFTFRTSRLRSMRTLVLIYGGRTDLCQKLWVALPIQGIYVYSNTAK